MLTHGKQHQTSGHAKTPFDLKILCHWPQSNLSLNLHFSFTFTFLTLMQILQKSGLHISCKNGSNLCGSSCNNVITIYFAKL